MKKWWWILPVIAVVLLIASRFIWLDRSARFVWDESDDLVRMKEIWDNKRLTLVGPISESNVNIYGSLSYYMLMPFAVAYNFNPVGPVVGTAFYSTIFILLLAFFLHKNFKLDPSLVLFFLIPIFPFLQTGRWAWNPHYVPLWQLLSVMAIFFASKRKGLLSKLLWVGAGVFSGLTIYCHWYAVFAVGGLFLAICCWPLACRKGDFPKAFLFGIGVILSWLPMVVFDLKNPPGLFLTRFIFFGPWAKGGGEVNYFEVISRIPKLSFVFVNYFFQNPMATWGGLGILGVYFIKIVSGSKKRKLLLLLPVLANIIGLALVGPHMFEHYLLGSVLFFVLFLLIPDNNGRSSSFQKIILIYFFVFSLKPAILEITKNTWMTNIGRTRKIADIVQQNIGKQRCNVFVAASPDQNTTGKRYRDLLKVRGINLMMKEEYRNYECLFVISTSGWEKIQKDAAYELDLVRNNQPVGKWQVEDWFVYKAENSP